MMASPIWPIEGVELDSTGDLIADSLADRILSIQGAVGGEHIPLFAGTIYYVDAAQADDTGNGQSPETAKKTIGAGIGLLSVGDALTIKAGTYTETGLDLNVNSCELWPEIGTVIAPATGVGLTISGHYCKVWMPGGSLFITAPAGQTGLLISGNRCYVSDVRVNCASSANLGFDLSGNGGVLDNCRCASPLIAAFKIQGDKSALGNCCTVGSAGDTSIGFWVTNSCDVVRLKDCGSRGHETSGFQVDTGCTGAMLKDCASGGGDGRWVDADDAAVWSDFTYDDEVTKITTFTAPTTTFNVFKVTGAVRVSDIHGHVETVIPNVASDLHLELFSSNGTVDITLGPGVNIQAAVAGALLVRNAPSTTALDLADPNASPAVAENTNWRDPRTSVDVVKDDSADTYIRIVLSVTQASGAIHWHCHWEPLSDDGFLESA